MTIIEFPQQTGVIGKDQPPYKPLPAYMPANNKEGLVICCWQLTWGEMFRLLFTRKIWHSVLTFNKPLQPQLLQVDNPLENIHYTNPTDDY